MDKQEWARLVKETRDLSSMVQEDFAAKMKVTQQTISNWESGKMPRKSTIDRVLAVCLDLKSKAERAAVSVSNSTNSAAAHAGRDSAISLTVGQDLSTAEKLLISTLREKDPSGKKTRNLLMSLIDD